ncbi:MAG: alcohol dehydrogenase catalytic domain-containing protein [Blastocatellia bacterium]
MTTMRAAVMPAFGEPLTMREVPLPEPGPGEVLLRVAACGVCHSDLHLIRGEWEQLKPITRLPLIPGHEVTGTVVACGPGEMGDPPLAPGDRVGVPWLHSTCGTCEYCLAGRETLCLRQQITGVTVDGGYAEYLKAPASHTIRIPDNLGFVEAAPLFCAGLTVYAALRRSGIGPGERLALFGVGGLGHLAIQLAVAQGIEVIAVDLTEEKLALARACGAAHTLLAGQESTGGTPPPIPKQIRQLGGAHVALVTAGSRVAYETALRSLRRGGTLAMVGMAPEPMALSSVAMVAGEFRIVASAVGTRQELREVLDLAARGGLRCHVETVPFEEVDRVLREMHAGHLTGRVVLNFP